MNDLEFKNLDYGTVVYCYSNPEKFYKIDNVDVFGATKKENIVYGASEINGHGSIRIDRDNKKYWFVKEQ